MSEQESKGQDKGQKDQEAKPSAEDAQSGQGVQDEATPVQEQPSVEDGIANQQDDEGNAPNDALAAAQQTEPPSTAKARQDREAEREAQEGDKEG